MTIPDYKPFRVVGNKADIQQMYVSVEAHSWIKQQATDNGVRMINVVDALIDHAEKSDKAFKHLLELLNQQDYVLAQGGVLPEKTTAEIRKTLEKYGV